MKLICTILFVCSTMLSSRAQTLVNGYIVLPNGDSLFGKINFGGIRRATTWQEVTLVNTEGVEKKYRAQHEEVKGYGYEVVGVRKDFIYFRLKQKADSRWFERIHSGASYTLYRTSVTGSFGTVDVTAPWYVLQKPTGEFVFLENCGLCAWRKKLAEFLTDNPEALAQAEDVKAKELGEFLRRISK
jgi:hypothetical protein